MPATYTLLQNRQTTGSGDWVIIDEGGIYVLEVEGTWGSTTATFQRRGAHKGNAISLLDDLGTAYSFTADKHTNPVAIGIGESIRVTLTGGSGMNLSAAAKRVG